MGAGPHTAVDGGVAGLNAVAGIRVVAQVVAAGGVQRGSSVGSQSEVQPAGGGITSMVQVATPLHATPSSHRDR